MADAPRSDSLEAEQWDAARVREAEGRCLAQGLRLYAVAACHPATGELAALTQVARDPATPGWAFQGLTAVVREHRGRRLGLLVKAAMHQWLAKREPDVRHVVTGNAEANQHMIAIDEQLGFAISDRFRQLELGEPGSPQS
jgi:RimJ/RimL family protein N-acetyltransferase